MIDYPKNNLLGRRCEAIKRYVQINGWKALLPRIDYCKRLKMKVLLNALSIAYPISGVGQYTLQMGRALGSLLCPEKVLWFGKDFSVDSHMKSPGIIDSIQYCLKDAFRKIPGLRTRVHIWRNHRFQSYACETKPSLYHETNYVPFDFQHGPTIITVCDLSFVRHPEWHPVDRVKYFEEYCLPKLGQVEAVITISEFSRREILNLLNVDQDKIYVTPLGVDQSFTPGKNRMQGLPERYILYVGNPEPRKNLQMLLYAYRSLPKNLQERYPLVLAGAKGWHTNEIKKTLRSFHKDGKIISTGYIPQALLPDLYRGASLFVYPSLYEGFGLPVIEAMACGVPVITSNTTSLPEVVGDAGVLVNPYDIDELREALHELLINEKMGSEMIERGLERAKLFTWEKCARETLDVYEKLLGERR